MHGGVLYTPPIDGTLLTGITRDTVITLARDAGITVIEKPLPRDILYIARSVLSGYCVRGHSRSQHRQLNVGDARWDRSRAASAGISGNCKGTWRIVTGVDTRQVTTAITKKNGGRTVRSPFLVWEKYYFSSAL